MPKVITYECKECGCEITVSGGHEAHLRPIYCCGRAVSAISPTPRKVKKAVRRSSPAPKKRKTAAVRKTARR